MTAHKHLASRLDSRLQTIVHNCTNRPISNSLQPLFQGESKCKVFVKNISFQFNSITITKISLLRLALKKRPRGTQKWSIKGPFYTHVISGVNQEPFLWTNAVFSLGVFFFRDIKAPLSQIRVSLVSSLGAGQVIFFAGIGATKNKVRIFHPGYDYIFGFKGRWSSNSFLNKLLKKWLKGNVLFWDSCLPCQISRKELSTSKGYKQNQMKSQFTKSHLLWGLHRSAQ